LQSDTQTVSHAPAAQGHDQSDGKRKGCDALDQARRLSAGLVVPFALVVRRISKVVVVVYDTVQGANNARKFGLKASQRTASNDPPGFA
jgi:hypothetical protein